MIGLTDVGNEQLRQGKTGDFPATDHRTGIGACNSIVTGNERLRCRDTATLLILDQRLSVAESQFLLIALAHQLSLANIKLTELTPRSGSEPEERELGRVAKVAAEPSCLGCIGLPPAQRDSGYRSAGSLSSSFAIVLGQGRVFD